MLTYVRSLPVRHSVDVFIAGGGPSGVSAAVIASRAGARVFLCESLGAFGGMGTSAGIPFICRPTDGVNFLCGGIGRELYDRLFQSGGAGPDMVYDHHPSEVGGFIYNPEVLKRVYDDLMQQSGADFTFNTTLLDLQCESGHVTHAICGSASGLFAVEAKVFIDATGNGDLAAMAGADCEFGDEDGLAQAATLCSLWSGIDWSRKQIWTDHHALKQAYEDGLFKTVETGLPGILHTQEDCGWGNVGHVYAIDPRDERTVTRGLMEGRKLAPIYQEYYRNYVPGCEKATMLWTAQTLGIREGRRILGDYVLNVQDFIRQAVFADEIGRFAYPVDLHGVRPEKDWPQSAESDDNFERYSYQKPGDNYGIPYRILLPRKLDNVLTAGRCVSTDRLMHGSLRVQAGCLITGQAAGMAAVLSIAKTCSPRALDVTVLQHELLKAGAFLPNCPPPEPRSGR